MSAQTTLPSSRLRRVAPRSFIRRRAKTKFGIGLMFLGVILLVGVIFIFSKANVSESKIKAEEIQVENFENASIDSLVLSASVIQAASVQKTKKQDKLTLSKKPNESFEPKRIYTSEILSSKIAFNAVGPHWFEDIPDKTKIDLEIRMKNSKGKWTDWYKIERSHHAKEEEKETFGKLIFIESGKSIQYRVCLETSDPKITPLLYNLKFTFIDSTQGPRVEKTTFLDRLFNKARAEGRPKIISRRKWGCDESLMFWNPEYYPVTAMVLHHTAGYDGGSNPAATVRGIYYYHAVTRGWGDIGYNFLVDKYGNIYEGRYGGDGTIGAHVYDEINKINYNKGSIGVSVLGSYGSHGISSKAKQALASLSASLLYDFDLSPTGQSKLQGKKVPSICAHRDLEPTHCPGDKFYSQIPSIRNLAREIQKSFGAKITSSLPQATSAVFSKTNTILLNFDESLNSVQVSKSQFQVKIGSKVYPILRIKKKEKQLEIILAKRIGYKLTPEISYTFSKKIQTIKAQNKIKDSPALVNFLASKRNSSNEVKVFDREGKSLSSFWAYRPEFKIGVSIALGDVDGDGEEEIIVGAGKGGGPHIRVFNKDGKYTNWDVFAFHSGSRGGVNIATGDADGDGVDEIAVSQASGGQAWIKVYKVNKERTVLGQWNAFGQVECGASIAMGDIDRDGKDEVIVGAGKGGGPQVRVFEVNGAPKPIQFFAFHPGNRDGINVAAGDVDGDGKDEIAVSQARDQEAHVKVYRYNNKKTILGEWRAFPAGIECGASIDIANVDGDGKDEVIVSPGKGYKPEIKVFRASGKILNYDFLAFDKKEETGLNVAVKNN